MSISQEHHSIACGSLTWHSVTSGHPISDKLTGRFIDIIGYTSLRHAGSKL
jgi:hypothetical protein